MIKIENVTCNYDKYVVLNKINTTINEKKITFIIGKNGSGKSTLSSILTGLKTFSGTITIDNEEVGKKTKIKVWRKKIGMVFQNPNNQIIFPSVYEDIKFALLNMGTPKERIDTIIKDVLKTTKMEKFINANPYNLSGGEKQRIAIASILALNPKYIIFDEATSMLDTEGKKNILELLVTLKNNNIGVIYTTNNLEELIYADDIIILHDQQMFKYTKEELFNNLNVLKDCGFAIPFNLAVINILNKKGIKVANEKDVLKELDNK